MQRSFWKKFSGLFIVLTGLAVVQSFGYGMSVDELRTRIDAKQKEIQALEAQADAYRKTIDQTLAKARTLKGEIARIDSRLSQLSFNLKITEKKIEAQELKIQELSGDITRTKLDVAKRKQAIEEVLRNMQTLDEETLLATMLRTDQLSDFFQEVVWLEEMQQGLHSEVEQLKATKIILEGDLVKSKEAKEGLQSLFASLQSQRKITENTRQERQTLLGETKNQEQNYQRLLTETVKKQEAIEKEIFELESELRRQIVSANLPPRQAGLFYWPVDGGYVTQEFGLVSENSITRDFYKFHNGIDIGARTGIGTPIRAVLDGTVIATGNNGRYAYGKWIAIKHGNGLTTLYAHFSLVGATTGDRVARGQVVGYMGVTGLATGPHLHLTTYASDTFRTENRWFGLLPLGGAINPRDYF